MSLAHNLNDKRSFEIKICHPKKYLLVIDRSINHAVREAVREFASIQDDLRRKLAATLSHDMRTPLAVVVNGAEVVQITSDLAVAKRAAVKIAANAERLGQMMTELLDALTSRDGGDQLPLTVSHFDIADLVDEVCGEYRRPGGIDLSSQTEPVHGYWCQRAMRRALENLINNAAKYGDGGKVNIVAAQTRGRLMLSVHNSGNPIPKERHGPIFDYLARGDAPSSTPGWGLGLPFVKRVAESHGGSVAVDSAPDTGTTFLIDIPVDCRPFVDGAAGTLPQS